jgi:hypothetical protein
MTREFETDRRGLMGGALGALTIAAAPEAIAAPPANSTTIRTQAHRLPQRAFRNEPGRVPGSLDQYLREQPQEAGSAIDHLQPDRS